MGVVVERGVRVGDWGQLDVRWPVRSGGCELGLGYGTGADDWTGAAGRCVAASLAARRRDVAASQVATGHTLITVLYRVCTNRQSTHRV